MAKGSQNSVSFERSLDREKARQKRRREGGQHTQLSGRLQQHHYDRYYDQVEVVLPKKGKTEEPMSKSFEKLVQDLLNGPDKNTVRWCPFHENKELVCRTTDKGWEYYLCPIHW